MNAENPFHAKQKSAAKKRVGAIGEELVARFLVKHGYRVNDRNYRRPWGELDVVAEKDGVIHFIEVKALSQEVSDETYRGKGLDKEGQRCETGVFVSSETPQSKSRMYIRPGIRKDRFRPEDSVGPDKTARLGRIIQTYLMEKHVSDETLWQFDVITVLLDDGNKMAKINFLKDIILERRY